MTPITYEYVKMLTDERLKRSLRNYQLRIDAAEPVRKASHTAEVVELTFPAECTHESIGA